MRLICFFHAFADFDSILLRLGDGINDCPAMRHADIGIAVHGAAPACAAAADMILRSPNLNVIKASSLLCCFFTLFSYFAFVFQGCDFALSNVCGATAQLSLLSHQLHHCYFVLELFRRVAGLFVFHFFFFGFE